MNLLLIQQLEQLGRERWSRQGLRILLRGCWLAACMWCIGIGGHLLWAWPLRLNVLAVLSLGIIGAALILLLRPRLSPSEVARRLDRRFHLDEQLATAFEMAHKLPTHDSVSAYLMRESSRTASLVRRRIARQQRPPWSEIIALVAMLLVLSGLTVMLGIGRFDADAIGMALNPLPGLAQPLDQQAAQEPFTPPQGGPQAPAIGDQSGQGATADPQLFGPIADALRDQGVTRPAADAIDRGDIAAAAQALRDLADQAGQLSTEARRDLTNNLRDAANQIEDRNPQLAQQLRSSAEGLRQGGNEASKALEDLARALEQAQTPAPNERAQQDQQGQQAAQGQNQAGQNPQDQGQQDQGGAAGSGNNPAGEQRQTPPSQRLGVEGKPIELDAQGQATGAAGIGDKPPSSAEVVAGRTNGGSSGDQQGQIGADPLRIPVEERNVVQDYFTP